MTVYVDDVRHNFGRMVMCHMWADRLDELLEMADIIGVSRYWIQGHPTLSHGKHRNASWVHFDISLGKKTLAIKAGAVLTDRYGPIEHMARRMMAHEDPALQERGRRKLLMVQRCRVT